MSHPDSVQLSQNDLKLEAGGVDVRNSAHRVVLSNITFNQSEISTAYWEYKILELVSVYSMVDNWSKQIKYIDNI